MIELPTDQQSASLEDMLLLTRRFDFASRREIDALARAVQGLVQPREGWFGARSITADVNGSRDSVHVDLRIRYRSRGIDYTLAKAVGTIGYDADTGYTMLRGKALLGAVWYGWTVFAMLITLMMFVILGQSGGAPWWPPLILVGAVGWMWWKMLSARDEVLNLLEQVAGSAPAEKRKQA